MKQLLWFALIWAWTLHASTKTIQREGILKPRVIDDSTEEMTTRPSSPATTLTWDRNLYCAEEQYVHEFIYDGNQTQMLWVTWNRTKAGENAVLPNMCSAETGLPLRRRCLLLAMKQGAEWEVQNSSNAMIQCHRSMFCETEEYAHHFIQGEDLVAHVNLWKRTRVNQKSTLTDMCLKPNGLPLTRKCVYNRKEHKAQWEDLSSEYQNYKCLRTTEQQIISNDLNSLLTNVTNRNRTSDPKSRIETSRTLIKLLESPSKRRLPADIHLSNEILKSLITESQDTELSSNVLQITHNLMASDPSVLRMSAELNATNSLLDTFESYMDAIGDKFVSEGQCHNTTSTSVNITATATDNNSTVSSTVELLNTHVHSGVYAHISGNISVFFVNPHCANISGIAIYPSKFSPSTHVAKEMHYDSFNDFHYRFIYTNESVQELLNDPDLELAAFVPLSMWQKLNVHFALLQRSPVIVFKVYAHDGLFVESNTMRLRKPFSKILSISIPGYEDTLPENLPFLLRQHAAGSTESATNPNSGCGYWNYSTWTNGGVQTTSESHGFTQNPLVLCYTNHLTQFSYLIGGNFKQNDLTDEILITSVHLEALDIISLVGCALSLMGLIGIWVTALMFKSWRAQASNKVLLNMCVALTLQMILFLFVNTDDLSEALVEEHAYSKCVLLGALLQYSLLVLFTWMLLIAFLQFQRYVTVIGIQRPKHYIAKSAVLAWGLPLIPTLCVALIDPKSYIPPTYQLITDTGICYPSGSGLHFGIILPISVIVVANLAIFAYVFYSISRSLSMTLQRSEKKLVIKQIRLSVLLFFLLGLSWIFGIFAFMKMGLVFSYLFCLTATMQGFVLFVYFVLLDENSRRCWQQVLCPHRAQKAHKKATELQSMTTASTSNGVDLSNAENTHSSIDPRP